MQLSKTLLFALIGTAFALPTEKRQLATIQGAVTAVQQSLQKLDTAVKAASDANSAAAVQTAATDVQNTLGKAQTDIQGAQQLQLQEALGLQQLATDLTTTATTTIDDLIAKKPTFDQLGVSQVVGQQLTAQKKASQGLGQAIVAKVPAIGQGIAQQNIDQITAAIDKGIQAYGGAAGGAAGATPATPSQSGAGAAPPKAPAAAPATPKTTPAAAPGAPKAPPAGGLESLLSGLLGGAGGAKGAAGGGGLGALLGGLTGGAGAGAGGAAGTGGAGGLGALLGGLGGGATGTGATKANVVADAAALEDDE